MYFNRMKNLLIKIQNSQFKAQIKHMHWHLDYDCHDRNTMIICLFFEKVKHIEGGDEQG